MYLFRRRLVTLSLRPTLKTLSLPRGIPKRGLSCGRCAARVENRRLELRRVQRIEKMLSPIRRAETRHCDKSSGCNPALFHFFFYTCNLRTRLFFHNSRLANLGVIGFIECVSLINKTFYPVFFSLLRNFPWKKKITIKTKQKVKFVHGLYTTRQGSSLVFVARAHECQVKIARVFTGGARTFLDSWK